MPSVTERKTKPTSAHLFGDWGDCWDGRGPARLGIVRCPDGDMDEWQRLSAYVVMWADFSEGAPLQAPNWGWYRWNPDPSGEFKQLLGEATGPGRGNWRGALVFVLRDEREGEHVA